MNIENEKQCSTQPTALFPNVARCPNKPTRYIFGSPYCDECANEMVEMHKALNIGGVPGLDDITADDLAKL